MAIKEVLCWVEMSRLPSHVLTLPLVESKNEADHLVCNSWRLSANPTP